MLGARGSASQSCAKDVRQPLQGRFPNHITGPSGTDHRSACWLSQSRDAWHITAEHASCEWAVSIQRLNRTSTTSKECWSQAAAVPTLRQQQKDRTALFSYPRAVLTRSGVNGT